MSGQSVSGISFSESYHLCLYHSEAVYKSSDLIQAIIFEDVLAKCTAYQNSVLKYLKILSYSFSQEWGKLSCNMMLVNALVVNQSHLRLTCSVTDWLITTQLPRGG